MPEPSMPDRKLIEENALLKQRISELEQSDAERQRAERILLDVIAHNPVSIQVVDKDGYVLKVNAAHTRLFGAVPPADYTIFNDVQLKEQGHTALIERARTGEIVTFPDFAYNAHNVDPSFPDVPVWIRMVIFPINGRDGSPERFVAMHDDITERKRAEAALRESEQSLRTSEERMARAEQVGRTGSWVYNTETNTIWGSAEGLRIFGYPPVARDWPIEDIETCIPERDRVHQALVALLSEGREYNLEYAINPADGSLPKFVHSIARIHRDAPGPPSRVLGFVQDITERRRAEEALAQSHDLLVNLARLVPGVIYQYRLYPDGRSAFPYSSPGMNDIYEVTPEDVQEDATPVFGRLHPDDYNDVANAIQESARTLQTFYCEFRVILPRQGLRWRWSQAHPERMEDGGTLWHGIISDITERKQAEAEKARLEGQLQQAQKMESVGRLAGGVAHDFNNMLGVILGHTELALEQVDAAQPLRADLEEIRKAATRSADLTRQLLAFARKQTIAPRVLDVNETITSMLAMLRRLIGEDIHLVWQPGAGLWPVNVDPSQIDQILANLCVNARDAISGVGKLTIETTNTTFDQAYCATHAGYVPGDYVRLTVSDDGCGMDTETVSHLFEPFFTTKDVGKGTGLGLATVYGIVKQNRGFINVYSEPGHGTTFTISLPRHVGKTEQMRMDAPAESAARGHETILLVEDEPAILTLTTRMLERQGYTVLAAQTPGEAIRLARDYVGEIHLLMTDVVMPEMNGRDLARNLLSLYPHLGRLFMSGYTSDVIAHHGVLDDGVCFIQKPFSIKNLAAKVREALDRE